MKTNQIVRRGIARHVRPGFSLLELTLVLVILGVLMAVAAVNVLGQGEKAKIQATKATLATIKNAVNQYHLEQSAFPTTLQLLVSAKILEAGKLNDAWQRPLVYDPQGLDADRPFVLFSKGPDGLSPSADDIDAFANVNTQPTQPQ
ncbi:MAG: type II secretion system protein GspG [Phycisphaerales bacterium]|nr:type II secretion system protein GspG [Phycisphaerales bacterium]